MEHRNDEWDYVIDRIDELRSQAQVDGDIDREEEVRLLAVLVKDHYVKSDGRVVGAYESPVCSACGSRFPCSTLKHEARRWRDREDFPKHLL
jgi:hypothetical protein